MQSFINLLDNKTESINQSNGCLNQTIRFK